MPTAACNSWNVFKKEEFRRVVFPSFERQPYAAKGQRVRGLILGCFAARFGQQTRIPFARRRREQDIGALIICGMADVNWSCLMPSWRRLRAVKCDVLLERKKIENGAWYTRRFVKIPYRRW